VNEMAENVSQTKCESCLNLKEEIIIYTAIKELKK
jgi:hypothetical protein